MQSRTNDLMANWAQYDVTEDQRCAITGFVQWCRNEHSLMLNVFEMWAERPAEWLVYEVARWVLEFDHYDGGTMTTQQARDDASEWLHDHRTDIIGALKEEIQEERPR